jgi:hypothetical protein
MTWDNNKNTFDSRPSVPSDEKLTAAEWNNHVSDQKGRVPFGPLADRPSAADADNGDVFFVTDLANDAGVMTKLVAGSWEIMGLGDASNKLPQVFADEVTTDDIPVESWQKWTAKNLIRTTEPVYPRGTLNNVGFWKLVTSGGGTGRFPDPEGYIAAVDNGGNGSTAEVRIDPGKNSNLFFAGNAGLFDSEWWWSVRIQILSGGDQREDYYQLGQPITNGNKGVGFKLESNGLKGVVHDGTSESTTSDIISPIGTGVRDLMLHFVPGSKAEFWVDDLTAAPDATQTSGLPSGLDPTIMTMFGVDNLGNDVQRDSRIGEFGMGVVG